MEAEGNIIINRYTYRGEEGEIIPRLATHVFVAAKVVRARTFQRHHNIVEVICLEDVEKIEENAFAFCPRLRRVIMPGVKIVEEYAFGRCEALTDVECGKLEIVKRGAFYKCDSLRSINLSSARIVEEGAFSDCIALTNAKFGSKLERIEDYAFHHCLSLERITIPLKDGIITHGNTFIGCRNLKHVDLVEEDGALHKTIAALHLDNWRDEMNEVIDSINQALPNALSGHIFFHHPEGEKALTIRTWIRLTLRQLGHYTAEHRRLLEEDVVPTLQCALPRDIVMNSVLHFLELPSNALFE